MTPAVLRLLSCLSPDGGLTLLSLSESSMFKGLEIKVFAIFVSVQSSEASVGINAPSRSPKTEVGGQAVYAASMYGTPYYVPDPARLWGAQ